MVQRWLFERIRPALHAAKRLVLSTFAIFFIAFVLVGCGAMTGGTTEPDLWGPFRSQSNWIVNGGTMRVELSGFERGHRPGLESEFEISVENRLGESLDTVMCVYLIDEDSIVQDLGIIDVELESDAEETRTIIAAFDEDIEPRPYGLAIVLQNWGAIVQTVRLGIPDEEAGPWLDVSELPCEHEAP